MITDALLNFGLAVFNWAWALVPEWDPGDLGSVHALTYEMDRWNGFLPVHEMMTIGGLTTGLVIAVVGFKVVVKIIDWIMDIIP